MTDTLPDVEQLKEMLAHIEQHEGEECIACHRPLPKVRADARTGGTRSVVSIHEPNGYEGTLDPLMIAVVDKFKEQWPRDYAAMRQGLGLVEVGGRSWRFFVTHFALYALLMVPELAPVEE